MLKFEKVSFQYKGNISKTIDNLSFTINDLEFVSIIGASGCGKSTIFRLINKLEKPISGEIHLNQDSAFMPQKDLLFPWRTVEKNISLPLEFEKCKKKEREKSVQAILKQVGLEAYSKKYPKDLSGGMRQRLSFARTLMSEANILLLDEPFSSLDYLTKVEMQEWLLDQWIKEPKTIIFITHDVEEAIFLSQNIYVIQRTPISFMKKIEVPLNYPRQRKDLKKLEIISLKENLINNLRKN